MIVRRIEVRHFRCFPGAFAVELSPSSINLISAPNGSGKSALVEALRMAFLISHKSASEEVKAVAPWGRALAPFVSVEYEADGARYRASKQWLQGASATLEQWRGGGWQPIASGPLADEQLRQAAGMRPGFDKGAKGKDAFWTSVLWSVQGGLKLDGVDPSVAAHVRASFDQQMDTGAAARIHAAIESAAQAYWTPTGRQAKHSPVTILEARIHEARQRFRAADDRLRELEKYRQELLGAEDELQRLAARLPALEKELDETAAARAGRDRIRAALEKEQAALDLARQQAQSLLDEQRRWRDALGRLQEGQTKAAALEQQAGVEPAAAAAEAKRRAEAAEEALRGAHAYLAARRERESRQAALGQCEQAQDRIRELETALAAMAAPPAALWPRLQKLHADLAAGRARLDAALVHLEVRAERALTLEVLAGEPPGLHQLTPGATLRVSGSPAVELRVPGMAHWRASGPPASAAELRSSLQILEREWDSLTSGFASQDYTVLGKRREEAARLESDLEQARARLRAHSGGQTIDALRKALLEFESVCAAHEARHPDWRAAPPQPEALEQELKTLRALVEAAQARVQAAREASLLRGQMRADESLAEASAAAHGSPEQLAARLDEATLRCRGIELQVEQFKHSLAQCPPDLDARESALRAALETAQQQLALSREKSQLLRGRIEQLAAEAPCQTLAEADEEVEDLERQLAAVQREAGAALLLRETLAACRASLANAAAAAIAAGAASLLESIAGRPLGRLRLSEELAPEALVPASWDQPVGLDQLSGGEAEQVHFATRLALADRLAAEEPQLAVFDDVLMATDPARLARILQLLDARRPRLQILILTCHPERFASLTGANRVELPARG